MGELFAVGGRSVTWQETLLSMLLAFVLSQVVATLYARTYSGMSYARSMVRSLVIAGVVAALLMQAIGDNLARGIGIIGTLALIRFRTNLRDPWDMVFVFAAFAVGIAAGTGSYSVAIIGTGVFCLTVLSLTWGGFGGADHPDGMLRLQVPVDGDASAQLEHALKSHCRRFTLVMMREVAQGAEHEHAYHVSLKDPDDREELLVALTGIPGAHAVSLHMQEATVEL